MKELLVIDDISVCYGNIRALQNVSMHVNEGDIVCLIGANGSGKSTLLKAIVGLEPLVDGAQGSDVRVLPDPRGPATAEDPLAQWGGTADDGHRPRPDERPAHDSPR